MQEKIQKSQEYLQNEQRKYPRLKEYVRDPLIFLGIGALGYLLIWAAIILALSVLFWIFGPPNLAMGG